MTGFAWCESDRRGGVIHGPGGKSTNRSYGVAQRAVHIGATHRGDVIGALGFDRCCRNEGGGCRSMAVLATACNPCMAHGADGKTSGHGSRHVAVHAVRSSDDVVGRFVLDLCCRAAVGVSRSDCQALEGLGAVAVGTGRCDHAGVIHRPGLEACTNSGHAASRCGVADVAGRSGWDVGRRHANNC